MEILKRLGLYYRTLKFLKLKQIYFRALRFLYTPRLPKINDLMKMIIRDHHFSKMFPSKKASIFNNKFNFLNKEIELKFPEGWSDPEIPVLWTYNLHYFDGLLAEQTPLEHKIILVQQWIKDNSSEKNVGWDPYPLSLRICNLIKWVWMNDKNLPKNINASLFQQARYLEYTLEYHLLGNHLLENSKALIFSGCFFGGPIGERWLKKGIKILRVELEEQILNDGGHFELSPMYHSLMLELVLDVLQLSKEKSIPKILSSEAEFLTKIAVSMSRWLKVMSHPDGELSYFNDSAIGVAEAPQRLFDRTKDLTGIDTEEDIKDTEYLQDSGYIRLQHNNAVVFFDVAQIGASYLAGHGHADTLAIEFSLFDLRLFVNIGSSEYGNGPRREYERSTAAHSTVEINGQNSSEIWSGFRVGRRANVKEVLFLNELGVSATHDGYKNLPNAPLHQRTITLNENKFVIEDNIGVYMPSFLSRFHLHPDVLLEVDNSSTCGYFILKNNKKVFWESKANNVFIESNFYANKFGVLSPIKTLVLNGNDEGKTKLIVDWS